MFAHSPGGDGRWHDLIDHLHGTAERAQAFGAAFDAGELARLAGLMHDLGKCHPQWQDYLRASHAGRQRRGSGGDHKAVGAQVALDRGLPAVALAIAGHHGGLPAARHSVAGGSYRSLRQLLHDEHERAGVALEHARTLLPELDRLPTPDAPTHVSDALAADLFARMLFSALVDADFLDTEEHFNGGLALARDGDSVSMSELFDVLERDQRALMERAQPSPVNDAREAIYQACVDAAALPPGLFRLTVPTGGGKTRSGLAFALRHAALHGLRRVVVAVPFISITEQTAQAYRQVFGARLERAVLEHHSGIEEPPDHDEDHDASGQALWTRLAAENWDAPLVVTTTVQLFESLFARKPSRVRKLHRLARSVIVLDEAQSLPPGLLEPTLDVLRRLVNDYGVTVVLSTATQPAFDEIPAFRKITSTEIVPNPARYFEALQRVEYDLRLDQPLEWVTVAEELAAEGRALAIVNTKHDALALLDALEAAGRSDVLHLSTLLCGEHRRRTIEEVHRRLEAGEPCLVVSTQVVEAGVDLDFPTVFRAFGPLDAIVQAAGRCNREGKGGHPGRVVVFEPADGGAPPGVYRTALDTARTVLRAFPGHRPDDLEVLRHYFELLYGGIEADAERIQEARRSLDFPAVAERYRLIDDDTVPVAITDYAGAREDVANLLERLRAQDPDAKRIHRQLQPYTVALRRRLWDRAKAAGLAEEVVPGLGQWMGEYDEVRGLQSNSSAEIRPSVLIA